MQVKRFGEKNECIAFRQDRGSELVSCRIKPLSDGTFDVERCIFHQAASAVTHKTGIESWQEATEVALSWLDD